MQIQYLNFNSGIKKLLLQTISNFPQQYNILGSRRGTFWLFILQSDFVDDLHHLENHKCQEDEINWDGDEVAIGKDGYARFFEGIKGSWHIIWSRT